jgi:4-hydroxymandelate oxidase
MFEGRDQHLTAEREILANATLREIEAFAANLLPSYAHDYYASGARDEQTFRGNLAGWGRWWLVPRMLNDVAKVSLETSILGNKISVPLMVAPMASQRMAHPLGELATARAAAAAGTVMIVSTSTTTPIEEIGAVPGLRFFYQLYPWSDHDATVAMVDRAVAAGAKAIVLTVDVTVDVDPKRRPRGGLFTPDWVTYPMHHEGASILLSLDWAYFKKLRGHVKVPIVVKGILHPDDARRAIDEGADAIEVSNHGGRTLDGAIPTAEILPEVVEAVDGRVEILVDGGIRRGVDILRALALGARVAVVGRPFLWGLAVGGEEGSRRIFSILTNELRQDAAYSGVTDIREVPRDLVRVSRLGIPS